jgi:hypothetical protein
MAAASAWRTELRDMQTTLPNQVTSKHGSSRRVGRFLIPDLEIGLLVRRVSSPEQEAPRSPSARCGSGS